MGVGWRLMCSQSGHAANPLSAAAKQPVDRSARQLLTADLGTIRVFNSERHRQLKVGIVHMLIEPSNWVIAEIVDRLDPFEPHLETA